MNDIDNLKKYINIINYVIKKIENDNDINDDIVKTVCLNVSENIDKIKNILSKRNLEDDSDSSDESTNNNICDMDDSDGESIEDEEKVKDDDEGNEEDNDDDEDDDTNEKESIIYYQKYPNQRRKLEIFNKTIFIF
jgi:hypothetical protein